MFALMSHHFGIKNCLIMTQIDKFFNLSSSRQAFIGFKLEAVMLFTVPAYSIISVKTRPLLLKLSIDSTSII